MDKEKYNNREDVLKMNYLYSGNSMQYYCFLNDGESVVYEALYLKNEEES